MTAPKANGNNARYALTEARRGGVTAANLTKKAFHQLDHMRESLGRPDYATLYAILGQLSVELLNMHKHHEELWALRQAPTGSVNEELLDRVATLEAIVAELQNALGVKLS